MFFLILFFIDLYIVLYIYISHARVWGGGGASTWYRGEHSLGEWPIPTQLLV